MMVCKDGGHDGSAASTYLGLCDKYTGHKQDWLRENVHMNVTETGLVLPVSTVQML